MPKRKNRLKAIEHERRQMDMLRELTPNTTPEAYQDLSNRLLDIAQAALGEVYELEAGDPPNAARLRHLAMLIERLKQVEQG